jgi:hypothetical protein
MSADLRAAARNEPLAPAEEREPVAPEPGERPRPGRPEAGRENPFADLEPPSWVES